MYTKLQNGKIQVCNFLISTGLVPFAFLPRYSDLQAIVSTAGIVLSLLALLVTLISYCMFPALRTRLENIAIMILCGCLIVAQLLLLFAGFATVHPILCSVVSGLGHFFWLSVFSSSNILGLLLIRTFGLRKEKTLRGKPPSKCSISIVMLICFVCPALISGTLLVLYYPDEDDLYGIIYGSTSGCWIGGPMINLYAFGIPVAVSLLINIIFFIHITISIFIQMKKSQRLRRKQSRVRELLIYVKIFVLLGLVWITGFLAAWLNQPWLWYLFITLTSLQGVFIFLAFIVKSQIWRMWRKRLSSFSGPSKTSSQTNSISLRNR